MADRLTLKEVLEKLSFFDEVELLEHLRITSEDLARAFMDLIEDRLEDFERIVNEYE